MKSSTTTSSVKHVSSAKLKRIRKRLVTLYGLEEGDILLDRFFHMIGRYGVGANRSTATSKAVSEKDAVLITYADMVQKEGAHPLSTLREFCTARLKGAFSAIHILPFYPWTSDDGFSVVDYREVDKRYGNWDDISRFSKEFELMFDLVLNHCSSKSPWFREYISGVEPGSNYILEGDEKADLSAVVRPRATPLLTPYQTRGGERHVWTTFSADQVDLDWTSSDLLFEFLDIIMFYASLGCRILRLDAVAFLWKELGTNCLHLPKTHQVIKLIRNFIEVVAPEVLILTETNVPHPENISYFGKGDEAHAVYQFSLPPLLLHGLLRGTAGHVTNWAVNLDPPPKGCHFLNFTASHDGIGVRPLEGILSTEEILALAEDIRKNGGFVSMRKMEDGTEFPYELNTTYYGALSDKNDFELGKKRFLCSQAIALAMKGIPAVYFHSLCATPNYTEGVKETGHNRTINRRKWGSEELENLLDNEEGNSGEIFEWYTRVLRKRASCPAFHPDAGQTVLDLGDEVFAFERKSIDGSQTLLCLFNFLSIEAKIDQQETLSVYFPDGQVKDLISGGEFSIQDSFALRPYQSLWLCTN
jgi:sucrose phosphorylase